MQWHNAEQFIGHLTRRGFKEIGRGYFSTILAKPGQARVIKVQRNEASTDGWPKYVHWAAEHGYSGTYAPKVYSFRTFATTEGDTFYVAIVERLGKRVSHLSDTDWYEIFKNLRDFVETGDIYTDNAQHIEGKLPGIIQFLRNLREALGNPDDAHDGNWMVQDARLILNDPYAWRNTDIPSPHWKLRDFGYLPFD